MKRNCNGVPLAWIEQEPFVERNHPEGGPRFRIIEDDGCYVILRAEYDNALKGNAPREPDGFGRIDGADRPYVWNDGVLWIDPELWEALRSLPPPRGALWDARRDGGTCPENIEMLVERRLQDVEEDRKKARKAQGARN